MSILNILYYTIISVGVYALYTSFQIAVRKNTRGLYKLGKNEEYTDFESIVS